jgi:DNA polymerase III delta prime subunit
MEDILMFWDWLNQLKEWNDTIGCGGCLLIICIFVTAFIGSLIGGNTFGFVVIIILITFVIVSIIYYFIEKGNRQEKAEKEYEEKINKEQINEKKKRIEEENKLIEEENKVKRLEEEIKKTRDKLFPILFSKIPKEFIKLNIEKKIDKLFLELPNEFALCFVGNDGLGKTYQAARLNEEHAIFIETDDSYAHELGIFIEPSKEEQLKEISTIYDNKLIFIISNENKIIPRLRKKLIIINFQPYTPEEIMIIIRQFLSDEFSENINFIKNAKEDDLWTIAKNCKGNAGEAVKIVKLANKVGFDKALEILGISVSNEQLNLESVKSMSPYEFQEWAIKALGGKDSATKVGDMGIDGIIEKSNFWHQEAVIQVKQFENIGRNVVDNFETAMKRAKYDKGYIVAYSFTNGAFEETKRAKNEEDLEITLLTAEEIVRKIKIHNFQII